MKKFFVVLFLFLVVGCSNHDGSRSISYVEAKEKMINNQAILLDVRSEAEYKKNHINGAILLSLDMIDQVHAKEVIGDTNQYVIVYCQSGNRSKQAVEKLLQLGYSNVYDLGSINNWRE